MIKDNKIVKEKGTVILQLIKVTSTFSRFWYANVKTNANSRSKAEILRAFIGIN
jgi:hypothetical protein